jgi:hypothetical protein
MELNQASSPSPSRTRLTAPAAHRCCCACCAAERTCPTCGIWWSLHAVFAAASQHLALVCFALASPRVAAAETLPRPLLAARQAMGRRSQRPCRPARPRGSSLHSITRLQGLPHGVLHAYEQYTLINGRKKNLGGVPQGKAKRLLQLRPPPSLYMVYCLSPWVYNNKERLQPAFAGSHISRSLPFLLLLLLELQHPPPPPPSRGPHRLRPT